MTEKRPILQAKAITKTFSFPTVIDVLKGVSFEICRGESLAIMGASGEGKSTLLHILGTLEKPTKGSLYIADKLASDYSLASLRNRHIGFIFQAFNLLEEYTALQNVLMPAFIAGKEVGKDSSTYKRALDLLGRVGLSKRAHFLTKLLSGGEKQRVAIARALCNDPEIILADEPTGNLDYATSEQIHKLLFSCVKEFNKALIIVTHDRELASLCDRLLILQGGKLMSKNDIPNRGYPYGPNLS